jgi:hypothetical protein
VSDESTAIMYILTGFRDAMTELSNKGDFHAKVILHHFFQQDSKVKYDAIAKTAGATLIKKRIAKGADLESENVLLREQIAAAVEVLRDYVDRYESGNFMDIVYYYNKFKPLLARMEVKP